MGNLFPEAGLLCFRNELYSTMNKSYVNLKYAFAPNHQVSSAMPHNKYLSDAEAESIIGYSHGNAVGDNGRRNMRSNVFFKL